jgi:hypothetical protein
MDPLKEKEPVQNVVNPEIWVIQILNAWNAQIESADNLFNLLTDEQLQQEVAPGRNTGIYLLGHLTAVNDGLLPLFGLQEKLYPQLENLFLDSPDNSGLEKPGINDLRNYWREVNKQLSDHIQQFSINDWLQKHNSISAADFAKEPHRNKLNVLLHRTGHLAYHLGQLAFLKK